MYYVYRICAIFIFLCSGCSASTQESIATSSYWGDGRTQPYITGMPIEAFGHGKNVLGPVWRIDVHNPLNVGVSTTISCDSIFQGDVAVHVAARSVRALLVTLETPGPNGIGGQPLNGCWIAKYEIR